jgi:hypothetical protein
MQSIDPPTPVLMLPLGNSTAEAGQAATAAQEPQAALRAELDAGAAPHGADTRAETSEGGTGTGGEEQRPCGDAPGSSGTHPADAGAGDAGDDSAIEGALRPRGRVCAVAVWEEVVCLCLCLSSLVVSLSPSGARRARRGWP